MPANMLALSSKRPMAASEKVTIIGLACTLLWIRVCVRLKSAHHRPSKVDIGILGWLVPHPFFGLMILLAHRHDSVAFDEGNALIAEQLFHLLEGPLSSNLLKKGVGKVHARSWLPWTCEGDKEPANMAIVEYLYLASHPCLLAAKSERTASF